MEKLPRKSTEAERLELKAATRRALDLAGKANAFALVTRVEAPALSKYGSPSEPAAFMPIDVMLDLCRDVGAPVILDELAAILGYRLAPVDGGEAAHEPVTMADIAAVSREGGDVVNKTLAALADGKICPVERTEIRQDVGENIAVLRALDRKLAGEGN